MPFFTSITRISDLRRSGNFAVEAIPREHWARGDYVMGTVTGDPSPLYLIESTTGRMVPVMEGDHVIGAFGDREATLEGVGSWQAIEGRSMHALTAAGLLGLLTSKADMVPGLMELEYVGHITRDSTKLGMGDFVRPAEARQLDIPVIALVGTSMSAGKTTTGRVIIHELKKMGMKVAGVKLTGAARYRDILRFKDAGADAIFDFVDMGLPSTVIPEDEYRPLLDMVLSRVMDAGVDVLVAEAGASPLEPYNGAACIEALSGHMVLRVLCASDPYAVVGVQRAYGFAPDVVAGPAAATRAAIRLVKKLTGVPAVNVLHRDAFPEIAAMLKTSLGIS
ncbi:MAG: DUF1611 domain-containing protein [Xanthomonadales bacterium]|nr:DUF1611 domain-containing protein [Xanthomonadales bacterium]